MVSVEAGVAVDVRLEKIFVNAAHPSEPGTIKINIILANEEAKLGLIVDFIGLILSLSNIIHGVIYTTYFHLN